MVIQLDCILGTTRSTGSIPSDPPVTARTLRAQKRNERGNTWVPKKKSKNKEEADVALAIERSRLDEEEREKKVLERKKSYDAAVAESKMMSDAQAEKRALYEKPKRIFIVSGDPPLRFEGIFKTIPGDGHCGWRASPMYQHKKMSIEEVKTLVDAWISTNRVRWIESPWKATQADQYHMVVLGLIENKQVLCYQPGNHPHDTIEEDGHFVNLTQKFKKAFFRDNPFPWEGVFSKTEYLVFEFSNFALDFSKPRDHWSTFTFNGEYFLRSPRRIDTWNVVLESERGW